MQQMITNIYELFLMPEVMFISIAILILLADIASDFFVKDYKGAVRRFIAWTKSKTFKGVVTGMGIVLLLAVVVAFSSKAFAREVQNHKLLNMGIEHIDSSKWYNDTFGGRWFDEASMTVGIERTKKSSPSCMENDPYDNKSTSHISLQGMIYRNHANTIRVEAYYLHNSCVKGVDDRQHDALGIRVTHAFYQRGKLNE